MVQDLLPSVSELNNEAHKSPSSVCSHHMARWGRAGRDGLCILPQTHWADQEGIWCGRQEARSAKENKVKQRHSVEVISSAYLNYKEIDWQIVSFFTEIRKTKTMWQIWLIFVAAIYTLVS